MTRRKTICPYRRPTPPKLVDRRFDRGAGLAGDGDKSTPVGPVRVTLITAYNPNTTFVWDLVVRPEKPPRERFGLVKCVAPMTTTVSGDLQALRARWTSA